MLYRLHKLSKGDILDRKSTKSFLPVLHLRTWYVAMLFVKDITLLDLLRPTSYLLSDWPVANYQASNSSKISQKMSKKLFGCSRYRAHRCKSPCCHPHNLSTIAHSTLSFSMTHGANKGYLRRLSPGYLE